MSRFLPIETESAALLAAKLTAQLAVSQRTVATAESCTGGLLGQMITSVPGSSILYPGGVISYANQSKVELLGVQQATLFHHGAVSAEVVMEMAGGVRSRLHSDWAVAVSGIAGPSGGTEEKPVGLVYIAWLGPTGLLVKRAMYRGDRTAVRLATAIDALGILIKLDRRV